MEIVGVYDRSNPSIIVRASSQRAVRSGPFRHTFESNVALAVSVGNAGAVARTVVFAVAAASVSGLFVPDSLPPRLRINGGCRSRQRGGRGVTGWA